MAYDSKSIIKDVNGKPVPQYYNPKTDKYEVIESENNMLRVNLIDRDGNEIVSQDLANQISTKLDELIEAVK